MRVLLLIIGSNRIKKKKLYNSIYYLVLFKFNIKLKINVIFFLVILLSCNAQKNDSVNYSTNQDIRLNTIIDSLKLSSENLEILKSNQTVLNEVYISIKDTLDLKIIKRDLDSFFLKKYTEKDIITNLELNRAFKKSTGFFTVKKDIDPNAPRFESIEEIKKYIDSITRGIKNNTKVNVVNDSLRKKQN